MFFSQLITDPGNVTTQYTILAAPVANFYQVNGALVDMGTYNTARIWQRRFFTPGDNVFLESIQFVTDYQFTQGISPGIVETNAEFLSGGGLIALGLDNVMLPYYQQAAAEEFIRYGIDIPIAPVEIWSFVLNYNITIQAVGVPTEFVGDTLLAQVILNCRHTLPLTVAP